VELLEHLAYLVLSIVAVVEKNMSKGTHFMVKVEMSDGML
jgi:hypothetical protein